MADITITIDDAVLEILKPFKHRGEKDDKFLSRVIMEMAELPKPRNNTNMSGYRAMMVPDWFLRIGTKIDKEVAEDIFGKGCHNSAVSQVAHVRGAFNVAPHRRHGEARTMTDEKRQAIWEQLRELPGGVANTGLLSVMSFRNKEQALAWAKKMSLDDLIKKLNTPGRPEKKKKK
jgi:hypothetical protein